MFGFVPIEQIGALIPALPVLLLAGAGAALYWSARLVLGIVFHDQVDWRLGRMVELGGHALATILRLSLLHVAARWRKRRRVPKALHAARIGVDELYAVMKRGEEPVVLDVRSRTHRGLDGRRIPDARAVDLDDLERTLVEIPRDRKVVAYCACPNEASAVKVAPLLRERGLRSVRPLAGGIEARVGTGLEVETLPPLTLRPAPAARR